MATLSLALEPIGVQPTRVFVPDKQSLSDKDFRAAGGEAKIYVKDGLAFKIFHDPDKVTPRKKVEELSVLTHPSIIRPLGFLLSGKQAVGIYMECVENGLPLSRLFTTKFRTKQNIDDACILALVEQLRESMAFVHEKGCLVVDANEFNYLTDSQTFNTLYSVDVGSYQTPHFPATAIMESIRDPTASSFTELTDWYAFGILACQLFVGLHPFKGGHPKYSTSTVMERMKLGASIFDKGVVLPPATRDFSSIPDHYREWMIQVFRDGKRLPPPSPNVQFSTVLISKPTGGLYQDAVFMVRGEEVKVSIHEKQLIVNGVKVNLPADKLFVEGETLYTLYGSHFSELRLTKFGQKFITSVVRFYDVLPHATEMLDGFLYQDTLGIPYLFVPIKPGECRIFGVSELRQYKIVEGKKFGLMLEIIGNKNGRYDRLHITLEPVGGHYTVKINTNVVYQ